MSDAGRPCRGAAAALVLSAGLVPTVAAQPAPAPDPGGPAHVFYGAVPASPPAARKPWVLVFIHGLHGTAADWWVGNDMYARAHGAGFRTAFVSMSLDNSPNDAGLLANAAVVRAALPLIAEHYETEEVVIVGHSKGGLDAQAAMLQPATRALVRAVFTISTPNTGTELADWAFGPGRPIAEELGLLTPGVAALRVANVAAFRAVADPILKASGIPFFTIAGSDARGNLVTAITGLILYEQTPGQKNDGFVPVPRSRLPSEYASDLGEVGANHFAVDSGNQSFAKILARLQVLEQTLGHFERIAVGGLGDEHNTWTWSMGWFKGRLYVGTGREIECLSVLTSDRQAGTRFYPLFVLNGQCLAEPDLARSIAAEIWSYDPGTRRWQRVYKSPETVALQPVDGQPLFTARDVGFRGMTVFREADGTEALYVGGVTSGSVFEHQPQFAAEGFPPPRLLRSVDGVNFAPVPQDPGTFLGSIGNPLPGSTERLRSFRALVPYGGKLFATAGNFPGVGVVVASANPSAGNDAWFLAGGTTEQFPVWNLTVFNGLLYATTGNRDGIDVGFGVFKTAAAGPAPYPWAPVITRGAYQANPGLRAPNGLSFAEFKGQLYVGTNRPTELYRINPDDTWELVVGEPRDTPEGRKHPVSGIGIGFGTGFNGHFWRMASHGGRLYLSTWDSSSGPAFLPGYDRFFAAQYGLDFYRTTDGVRWEAVARGGFQDGANSGGRSLVSTPVGLLLGTIRGKGGADIYLCPPPACTPFEPPPGVPAPRSLEAESEEVSGRQVVLRWRPVVGAVQYRIYRSVVRPIADFLPEAPPPDYEIGLSGPFVQIGIRENAWFVESAPTDLQSLYFVRAEDAQGDLSPPSNFVGGPSKAAP